MKLMILIVVSLFCVNSFAEIVWLSANGSYNTYKNLHPSRAEKLRNGSDYNFQLDVTDRIPLFVPHYAYRNATSEDIDMDIHNEGLREVDFKIITHEVGLKFNLPFPNFDLYAGGGGTFGKATLDNEKHSSFGKYWQAGVNILFNKVVGIKLEYMRANIETGRYSNLNNKRLEFDQSVFTAGLVIRMGRGGGLYKD